MPTLLYQIALIIIIVRCGYIAFLQLSHRSKNWLDFFFHVSVVIVALTFLISTDRYW
ncbi:MAG TPA: hypothetical protein VGE40_00440 [Bacilli bacterium]